MIGEIAAPVDTLLRVGRSADPFWTPPLGPGTPAHHRFDDPSRLFATLYFAEDEETAYYETFQRFRPDPVVLSKWLAGGRPIADFGVPLPSDYLSGRVLARVKLSATAGAPFGDLFDLRLRQTLFVECLRDLTEFSKRAASVNLKCDSADYDFWAMTGPWRPLTQPIAQVLHARGFAGARFPSKITHKACWVVFTDMATYPEVAAREPIDSAPHLAILKGVLSKLMHGFKPIA